MPRYGRRGHGTLSSASPPPSGCLETKTRTLRKGDEVDLEDLGETLAQLGYERVTTLSRKVGAVAATLSTSSR